MYEKRMIWANVFLRDKFCVGYRTTSHCEGINAFVTIYSKSTHTILDLVQSLEMVAHEYRNKEMLLHFQSINSVIGENCLKEIEGVGALNLSSKRRIMNTMVYTLEEYEEPDVHIVSSFGRSTEKLDCQYYFWKKNGYPCRRIFFCHEGRTLK
ncbi:hypothetical protein Ahy_B01g056493 [Arachis hypogaea]|uniref:Protein FAR1-RELATED SEQUENCE n=1 Tax=Arachis hypogaea TaxID=3818 RepID=A0A445AZ03_ARAHY|nr:hypothetical protein Ahy_B01g056493 [Arachis hypogaea]